jgi:hypothetical protein
MATNAKIQGMTLGDYIEQFKVMLVVMLVRRYNWTVKRAYEFASTEIKDSFEEGLSTEQAYFKLFQKGQDLSLEVIL